MELSSPRRDLKIALTEIEKRKTRSVLMSFRKAGRIFYSELKELES